MRYLYIISVDNLSAGRRRVLARTTQPDKYPATYHAAGRSSVYTAGSRDQSVPAKVYPVPGNSHVWLAASVSGAVLTHGLLY